MRVVLNSDVLHGDYVLHGVPQRIRELGEICHDRGHVLAIPRTALWEVEQLQLRKLEKHRDELEAAYGKLANWGIDFHRRDPHEVIADPELLDLFNASCQAIELLDPTIEDFQEAHRRACYHLPPQSPDAKTDEMRDLVIWMTAIRIAGNDDGALLVSRDSVHVHDRGNEEAAAAGLIRRRTPEDALEELEVETPAGDLLRTLLEPAWESLRATGLPLSGRPSLRSVVTPQFVEGPAGPRSAAAFVRLSTDEGGTLAGRVSLAIDSAGVGTVRLTGIDIDGVRVPDREVTAEYAISGGEHEERMAALLEMLRGR
jgi:hypothetical protein